MKAADLPAALADRPVDPDLGLPVPFVNECSAGGHDFATLNGRRAIQCALSRICGMCGRALEYDIAFVGDVLAAETFTYSQPPMHVACAEAALRLCPHLAQPGRSRRSGDSAGAKVLPLRPSAQDPTWTMLIANSFEIERPGEQGEERVLLFHPGPAKALRHYAFHEGRLEEMT